MGARIPRPRSQVQIPLIAVVLECSQCQQTWEPDYYGDPSEAMSAGCPHCGGWTWTGQLTEPLGGAA